MPDPLNIPPTPDPDPGPEAPPGARRRPKRRAAARESARKAPRRRTAAGKSEARAGPQPYHLDTHDLPEATAVWQSLTVHEKMRVAQEAALLYRGQLLANHKDLVSIGFGRRITGGHKRKIDPQQPVVSFVVKHKWTAAQRSKAIQARHLPPFLQMHVEVNGKPRHCAVPTDVQALALFGKVSSHANGPVHAEDVNFWTQGVACCAARLNGGARYLVGCHHVLALSDETAGYTLPVLVSSASSGQPIGNLSGYLGNVNASGEFFDAALAWVTDDTAVGAVVLEPPADAQYAQSPAELAPTCEIRTFRGPITGQYANMLYDFPVDVWGAYRNIKLAVVVVLQTSGDLPQKGDSGSPVFDETGMVFQGMHIGGSPDGRAFFIPAFELLRASNYALSFDDQMLQLS